MRKAKVKEKLFYAGNALCEERDVQSLVITEISEPKRLVDSQSHDGGGQRVMYVHILHMLDMSTISNKFKCNVEEFSALFGAHLSRQCNS